MEFQILGPVGLWLDGQWLTLGSDKERVLLASLALDVGHPVAISVLIERLWDHDPPTHAHENTHTYVSRIRRHLRAAGNGPGAPAIVGRSHTYTLKAPRDSVDRHRFQRLVDAAFTSNDDALTVELLEAADGLWHAEPLAGVPGLWAASVRGTLAESRLSATTSRIGAELRLGRFAEKVSELSALVDRYPQDELLLSQLMLAYYGSGRYADSLRVHQRARQSLMTEYGALPGSELAAIHRGVLARVPAHELARGIRTSGTAGRRAKGPDNARGAAAPAPFEPPASVPPLRNLPEQPSLVGRRAELRALTSAIADKGAERGQVVAVEAVSGMAGVGKTALAVAAARLLAERYPDGQLYINLRGHAPAQEPLSARAALAVLLRLLGAPALSIPAELEGRSALWRTMLATRRVIIVLDDAAGPDQVGPLLPSGSPSLTIVASRRHLTGIPHALSVPLDVLPEEDAIALFRSFAGEERTRDMGEIRRIVRLCGYLPLAIELVAHRFRARPSWTLNVLAERLTRSPQRLAEIRSADQEQEMTRAFALSYRTLAPSQRTAFRLLGLHPGTDFTAVAAAALLGLPLDTTERLLEGLLASHLLREPVPDRFRYHDLLREYAHDLSCAEDAEKARREALDRLTTFYVEAAELADRMAYPHRVRLHQPTPPQPPAAAAQPDATARSWLAAERGNLLAVEERAQRDGDSGTAARLADSMAEFLHSEGHWRDAVRLLRRAVTHWERTNGEPSALCRTLVDLCAAQTSIGHYADATSAGERALELARALGSGPAEAESLRVLGTLNWHLGENHKALPLLQKSFAIKSSSGDIWEKARSRNNIAVTLLFLGEHERALSHFQRTLTDFREAGDVTASAKILNNIGELQLQAGDPASARHSFQESLSLLEIDGSRYDRAIVRRNLADTLTETGEPAAALDLLTHTLSEFRSLGDKKSQAETLVGLGEAHWQLGDGEESGRHLLEALKLAQDIGTAHHEVQALRRLGRADFAAGRLTAATDRLRAAVAIADRTKDVDEETSALTLLAEVRLAAGDTVEARMTLRQAFTLVERRDNAQAREIRRRLAAIGHTGEGESTMPSYAE